MNEAPFDATRRSVGIRRPTVGDGDEFVALAAASGACTSRGSIRRKRERFGAYVHSREATDQDGFLICDRSTGKIPASST